MPIDQQDTEHMAEALDLARRGAWQTSPNPMVGAVIVKEGRIVGRGFHERAGEPHAEIHALREAGESARGATLYCTLEPCCHYGRTPPCADKVVEAGIRRAVVAMEDPNPKVAGQGLARLREAGLEVETGCMRDEARCLNEHFVVFHETGRPFVTVKWAMTLDGRTASDANESRWISSEASRRHVHELRARHDAVMIGIGTVLADDPMLNVRLEGYTGRQPARVVIDGDLSIPRRARLLRERNSGPVILATTTYASPEAKIEFEEDGHSVIVLPSARRLVELEPLLRRLAERGIQSIFVEGGRQIHTTLLAHGLVDKVVAFVAPKILGGTELRSPVEGLGIMTMEQSLQLFRPTWTAFEGDMCVEGYLREP